MRKNAIDLMMALFEAAIIQQRCSESLGAIGAAAAKSAGVQAHAVVIEDVDDDDDESGDVEHDSDDDLRHTHHHLGKKLHGQLRAFAHYCWTERCGRTVEEEAEADDAAE